MGKNDVKIYPSIFIRGAVVFPTEKLPFVIEGEEAIETVKYAISKDNDVVIAFGKNGGHSPIGVLGKISKAWNIVPTTMGLVIDIIEKVKVRRIFKENKVDKAEIEIFAISEKETVELEAMTRNVYDKFKSVIELRGALPPFVLNEMKKGDVSPDNLGFMIASALDMGFKEKLEFIETLDAKKRMDILNRKLAREIDVLKAEKKIQQEMNKEVEKERREYILRERLRAIEKELGIADEGKKFELLENKLKRAEMPKDVEEKAFKEMRRLKTMPNAAAEAPYIQTYLDWLSELPWKKRSKAVLDIGKAETVLNEDHHGLEKVKERILEYLAVQKLAKSKSQATVMCFVGPPGTGKTSVGKSIARALGRRFYRMSLGGIRDEAEIRGHRRTYVGALPGRIIQGIHSAGVKNPVFMLDEIDKLGSDFRGDPSAALLEVLDPAENSTFSDHYLEVPFDLSEVIFIATANILDPIPHALRDRMEVIEFFGYTDEEKFHIAKNFIMPKVLIAHGLGKEQINFEDGAIRRIIGKYTREAGVRNLERRLSEICRKVARKLAEKEQADKIEINEDNLGGYLGPEEYSVTMKEEKDEVGISTGLAWTPAGGEIIFIEAALMPGQGHLTLTGQLGKTMQESAKAAISYIRSKSKTLNFNGRFFGKNDIHIHVPSGAIPKDGPSSGIAIATALASVLTGKKVKKEVALTGEVTLSGKVLEVGGIKEKVLAAYRAGVETVILPAGNEKNLADVPSEVRKNIRFETVSHMDEVLAKALIEKRTARARKNKK